MNKYLMNNAKVTELRFIASLLPKMIKRDEYGNPLHGAIEERRGSDLLAGGIKYHYNEIVAPNGIYKMRKPIYADHLRNLYHQYEFGGDVAVKKYVSYVRKTVWYDLPFRLKAQALWFTLLTHLGIKKRKPRRAAGSPNK